MLSTSCDAASTPAAVPAAASSNGLHIISKEVVLTVGQSQQLFVAGTNASVRWESDNPAVATVTATGFISAQSPGFARVVARGQGTTDTSLVTVRKATPVQLTADSITLAIAHSARLSFSISSTSGDVDSAQTRAKWSTSAPEIATVDSTGLVTGIAVGDAAIAVNIDGATDTAHVQIVSVSVAAISIQAPSKQVTLLVHEMRTFAAVANDSSGNQLHDRVITWSSSSPDVATITASGSVTAIAPGSSTITASSEGRSDSVVVTTVDAVSVASVTVTAPSSSVTAGQTLQATATVLDPSGATLSTAVAWASSAPTVAGVSASGLISGLNAGTAIITAAAGGKTGSVTLTVQAGTATPVPSGATDAELPREYLPTSLASTPSAGRTLRVAAGGNLQAALDSAVPGDKLLLAAGATFRGNYVVGPKSGGISGGWITVMSDGPLPAEGTRVSPTLAGTNGFPKLVSTTVLPALATKGPAARWRFIGLEFTNDAAVTTVNGTLYLGDAGSAQNSLSLIPTDIILDRVYVHGQPTTDDRRCVTFNGARLAIVESYVSECHSAFDAQAITGTNGPGPFKIVNNYLEASGENIAWGGADPWIPNLVPSDMEIRRNHLLKPMAWKGKWLAKNLYESKNSRRSLLDGNVFENSWPDGQAGYAIVLWSVNQSGSCTWCITQDVTFQNNVIKNATSGFQLSAKYGSTASPAMHHVTIRNNVVLGLDNPLVAGGTSRLFNMADIIPQLTIEHNTGFAPDATLVWGGDAPLPDHLIRNNLLGGGGYQIFTSYGSGSLAWAHEAGPGSDFSGNVVVGDNGNHIPKNLYTASFDDVGLLGGTASLTGINAPLGDLTLSAASPFKGKATDGADPGADIARIIAATAAAVVP